MDFTPIAAKDRRIAILTPINSGDLTGSEDPNDPAFGVPDGSKDAQGCFFYLDAWARGEFGIADLTGTYDPDDPGSSCQRGALTWPTSFSTSSRLHMSCPISRSGLDRGLRTAA